MKAKFYKKFTKKRFGGGSVFLAAHPDEVWQWIEEAVKETRKCAGCDNLIYHQVHCPNCKRLLET